MPTGRTLAISLCILGALLAIAGVAVIYVPAGLILAGVGLATLGLVGIET